MKLSRLQQSLKRLAASDTPRKRKNALTEFRRAVRAVEQHVVETYRPMRPDGSLVPLVKQRGRRCPYCNLPMRSVRVLIAHLRRDHEWSDADCVCGKCFSRPQQLVRHLAAIEDLNVHVARSVLLQSAGKI